MATMLRKVELNHVDPGTRMVLKDTLALYRSACAYIGEVVFSHWDSISAEPDSRRRLTIVEALIHKTKVNTSPEYPDFDRLYFMFPSYFRRSAVHDAIGQVSSYFTRVEQYDEEKHEAMSDGKPFRKKPPMLNLHGNAFPALYRNQSWRQEGKDIYLKVYKNRQWGWIKVGIPERDLKCLRKMDANASCKNPSLVFAYGKFYLHFPFTVKSREFPRRLLDSQLIMGVDLGVNHGAVCSVVDSRGRVSHRAFDPFAAKRHVIDHLLAKIRHIQKKSGPQQLSSLYTKLKGVKEDYVRQLASWIVKEAMEQGVYGIVLEHLGKMKWRGRHKDRLHHWCKAKIRDLVRAMALRNGIRVFIINPSNTSALAYDGSGKVARDENNFSKCTFANGKQYDCDLSASYNIAARYFLRAMQKAMSPEAWEAVLAEVPELSKRTNCTLSTLWKLSEISVAEAA